MAISEKATLLALGITAIGFLMGLSYQAVSQVIDRRKYPPQGELIDLGGFRLHLNCVSNSKFKLESGFLHCLTLAS